MRESIQTGELLRDLTAVLLKRAWLILVVIFIFLAAAFLVTKRTTRIYEAATTLYINPSSTSSASDVNSMIVGQRLADTYAKIITTNTFLGEILERLDLAQQFSLSGLRAKIKVKPITDTQLLVIRTEDRDPVRAAEVANTIARTVIEQNQKMQLERTSSTKKQMEEEIASDRKNIAETQEKIEQLRSGDPLMQMIFQDKLKNLQGALADLLKKYEEIRMNEERTLNAITVVDEAIISDTPIKPRPRFNLFISGLLGIFVALISIIVLEFLDPSFKKEEEIERALGLPILGTIERLALTNKSSSSLILSENPRSSAAEELRIIRTNIKFASPDKAIKSLLITSVDPQEGKSFISANLAETFASLDQKVLLVDGDLRKPTLHRFFGTPNIKGFSDILLTGKVEGGEIFINSKRPSLKFIPSGHLPPNPAELLGSKRLSLFLEKMIGENDMVIFDSPPTTLVADAGIIGPQVDGVIIIAQLGKTSRYLLKRIKNNLAKTGVRILGLILNKAEKRRKYYKKGYYYYRYREKGKKTTTPGVNPRG